MWFAVTCYKILKISNCLDILYYINFHDYISNDLEQLKNTEKGGFGNVEGKDICPHR